ncbi:MAG: hypothetical protein Q8P24_10980 [Desulfobacterales bacterium]|nr:hypothetical protein [Desulfobacterales bacterium]
MIKYQPNCPMLAAMCAWTALQHGHHVKIEIRKLDEHTDHAQAQALVDGEWVWLTESWDQEAGHLWVHDYKPHYPDAPVVEYFSLQNWNVLQVGMLSGKLK